MADTDLIAETVARMLADAPLDTIDEAGGTGPAADRLWSALEENGFTGILVAEAAGGAGMGMAEAFALFGETGRAALPLPLAETVLAGWLLSECGISAPKGPLTFAIAGDVASGTAYAGSVSKLVLVERNHLRLIDLPAGRVSPLPLSEDHEAIVPIASLPEPIARKPLTPPLSADLVTSIAATMRAAQMAGAMQAILDLTLSYTSEREQFGRPLSRFQAIQHHLSDMACETAAAAAAVEMAVEALADLGDGERVRSAAAVAKVRCGAAATRVAASAHQAHGAMGFTREYALGRYTRRLWQWQDAFGSEAVWAIALGESLLNSAEPVWHHVTDTQEAPGL